MSRKKDKFEDPLKKHGILDRLRYRRMARKGEVPDEYKGTDTGKDIKKKMRQNEKIRKGWGLFAQFIKEHKVRYLLGVLSIVTVNVLSIMTPIIIGQIVDMVKETVSGNENLTERRLLILCLVIVGISFAKLVSNFLVRYLLLGASNLMEYVMRKKMFSKLVDLSMAYFNRKNAGELMALSTNDLRALRMAIGRGIMMITNAIVLLGAGFIYLSIKMSLPLTLAIMIPFPIMIFIAARFGKFIHSRFRTVQETFSDISSKTEEHVSGIRIIKSFVQEEQEKKNFEKVNRKNYDANVNLAKVMAVFHPSLAFLSQMAFLIILLVGGFIAIDGGITLGEFVAANAFLGMLIRPIRFIGMLINHLQQGKVSLGRISELIFEEPDIFDGKHNEKREDIPDEFTGEIKLSNLKFKYPDKDEYVFNDISTEIKAGQTVAVIGEVGSGKTTLVNLLMRIFDVDGPGMISFDGYDITDIPIKKLRKNIGYVPQDNFLFSDTIADNIGFSEEGYSREKIEEAAKKSNVYGNIIEFPDKFDTMLGEKGVNLSGGQKQRICIARALIKEAPVLILDDCLSSVDVETEKEILQNLREVREGRTCIIISHRVSTIKDSDKIIVLADGKIAEEGSHDELVEQQGIYDRMYRMQLIDEMEINGGEAV